jgi:hypothetical protein
MSTPIKLSKGDAVVTAFAERASGPGWANTPIWVIVQNGDGILRRECIQPEHRTAAMAWLYDSSEAAHKAMTGAVLASTIPTKKRKGGRA